MAITYQDKIIIIYSEGFYNIVGYINANNMNNYNDILGYFNRYELVLVDYDKFRDYFNKALFSYNLYRDLYKQFHHSLQGE